MLLPIQLALSFLPIIGSGFFYFTNKNKAALICLILGAFAIRMVLAASSPLQEWDEHFHALVAKNMMQYPFKPMLYVKTYLPYDYANWTANHIWLHKLPLFLWLMALSMKVFGVNVLALRLPSILMGTISVLMIYQIAVIWLSNKRVAYVAALLMACNYFQIELTTGKFATDHNDLAFTFFVTSSIWAFVRFTQKENWVNALLIGLFAACAVLVKWLPGLLIFGSWFLFGILKYKRQFLNKQFKFYLVALVVAISIFLPWQIYIMQVFPTEAHIAYEYNRKHILQALDDMQGSVFYHLLQWETLYGLLWFLIPLGGVLVLKKKITSLTISLLISVFVLYGFFTMVSTKMPGYTFPVSSVVICVMAFAAVYLVYKLNISKSMSVIVFLLLAVISLNPFRILNYHSEGNKAYMDKLNLQKTYKKVQTEADVVFNLGAYNNIDWMFYQNSIAYSGLPTNNQLDSLLDNKIKVAYIHSGELPDFILKNEKIEKLYQ